MLDDESLELGKKIRQRRLAMGLSLVRLAEQTDLSHPFLSQVERGHARPSVTSLRRIASALDLEAGWLFSATRGDQASATVVRHTDANGEAPPGRRGESRRSRVAYRAAGSPLALEHLTDLTSQFGPEAIDELGSVWYVIAGTVEVEAAGEQASLSEGDALFLAPGTPWRARATGRKAARVLVATASE